MLDCEENWVPKNWCFWTVVLENTLESPLDCKEIQPVHPKGDQSWVFIGRTDAEAETPVLWPPHAKSRLIGKDPDAGRDWEQESLSHVRFFATPWTAARQASLSITNSRSLLKLMSIESVMPSNHLILCHPLLLPPSIFPSIRGFSSESALCIRWPNYWNFSFLYFLYRIAFAFLSKIYWTYLCGSISEYSILKMCACLLPSIPLCLDYCN